MTIFPTRGCRQPSPICTLLHARHEFLGLVIYIYIYLHPKKCELPKLHSRCPCVISIICKWKGGRCDSYIPGFFQTNIARDFLFSSKYINRIGSNMGFWFPFHEQKTLVSISWKKNKNIESSSPIRWHVSQLWSNSGTCSVSHDARYARYAARTAKSSAVPTPSGTSQHIESSIWRSGNFIYLFFFRVKKRHKLERSRNIKLSELCDFPILRVLFLRKLIQNLMGNKFPHGLAKRKFRI